RAIVAATWRDPTIVGPLRAEQVIDLVVALGSAAIVAALVRRGPREIAVTPVGTPQTPRSEAVEAGR
ncbi:MAG: hypothetical protein QOF49_118, partial [Chloroflexota bacterium]|nr:hypothetical protein [Chloroflexota bacterium]